MNNYLMVMLVKIKNGQVSKKPFILQKKSFFCIKFLNILWSEGFILGYKELNYRILKIFLKYNKNNIPAINNIRFLTKPSKRMYLSIKQLWKLDHMSNYIIIVSTSKGLLTVNECKQYNLGGKVLFLLN